MSTYTSHRSKGFTLIELMVVISIIALLSSIIIASSTTVRAQARDALRIQEIHQIDNAVSTYQLSVGHAPDLDGNCTAATVISDPATCTALSTAASGNQMVAWNNLKKDLAPYLPISSITDPCNGSCTSKTGLPIGYTYVAPAALVYSCTLTNTCGTFNSDQSNWFQLYAPFENQNAVASSPNNLVTTPTIQSIVPTSGPIGTFITINGARFADGVTDWNTIVFGTGGIKFVAATNNGTRLTFTLPPGMSRDCPPIPGQTVICPGVSVPTTPGTYSVKVRNTNGTSNAVSFTVTP